MSNQNEPAQIVRYLIYAQGVKIIRLSVKLNMGIPRVGDSYGMLEGGIGINSFRPSDPMDFLLPLDSSVKRRPTSNTDGPFLKFRSFSTTASRQWSIMPHHPPSVL